MAGADVKAMGIIEKVKSKSYSTDLHIPSVARCNPLPTPTSVGSMVRHVDIAFKMLITSNSLIITYNVFLYYINYIIYIYIYFTVYILYSIILCYCVIN
ncbi:hypothetical protein EHP00_1066 [Ecytonucleospora hepatopenaei]|uniref:Uncharacterized protein n=1 Tax=Ecytonucleospora hepatopenaei TaxID=646526 RepID=A0A1W0E574_9MICR|nr:hypothetical protein EHP00_1066 [Ecytonucleospora hepatopenaei]